MNRIHAITAGLSFLGLLSATGYAELDKLSMGAYTVLALFLLAVFAVCAYRAAQNRKAADGRAIPVNGKRKNISTTIIPAGGEKSMVKYQKASERRHL